MCGWLLCAPSWEPGPQLRHVPWLGIKSVALWFTGWHSIHWATPATNALFLMYSFKGVSMWVKILWFRISLYGNLIFDWAFIFYSLEDSAFLSRYNIFEGNILESTLQVYCSVCSIDVLPLKILLKSQAHPCYFRSKSDCFSCQLTFCFNFHSFLLFQFDTQYIIEGRQLNQG